MAKVFCPLYGGECKGTNCIVWGRFMTVNPATGKPTGEQAGEGCMWFNKILKRPKRRKQ